MTNSIRSYQDLLVEKDRLKALLHTQKELVRQDIREIKEEFAPVKAAISILGKVTTKEPGNFLLTGTANSIIDLVVKKLLLRRSGWLVRTVVPFLLKNYSSHFIGEHKDDILRKVFSWFGKKKKKEKQSKWPLDEEAPKSTPA